MKPSEIAPAKAAIQRMLAARADWRPSAAELLKEFSHPDPPQPSVSRIASQVQSVRLSPRKWKKVANGGLARKWSAAVAIGKNIYVFGGWNDGDSEEVENGDILISVLNTETLKWRRVVAANSPGEHVEPQPEIYKMTHLKRVRNVVPFQRRGHTVCVWNGKIFLWGGRNKDEKSSYLHSFDPSTRRWSIVDVKGNVPPGMVFHSAVVHGDLLYILGDYGHFVFDFLSGQWTCLPKLDMWRQGHTAVVNANKMVVFGGFGTNSEMMELFDFLERTWSSSFERGDIPSKRIFHSAWSDSERMFILRGWNDDEGCLNDLYEFSFDTNTWKKLHILGDSPPPLADHCSVVVGSKVFVFGGLTNYNEYVQDLFVLEC